MLWVVGALLTAAALPVAAAEAVPLPFQFAFDGRPAYDAQSGFGYEPGTPERFSVRLPEGTYRVTLRLAGSRAAPRLTVRAEQRRLMLEVAATRKPLERSFLVNIRIPELAPLPANATGGTRVQLKPREIGAANWDDKLTLEFSGEAKLQSLRVEAATVPTLYIAGDSTVTDQSGAMSGSWGQNLPRFFRDDLVVANHAESGETLKSFVTELRLDKLLSTVRAGDWVMIQFAHNDQKAQWPQTYAEAATTYRSWLRTYAAEIRRRGATPILVTSPDRRNFDAAGKITTTLGDYPEAMRAVAREDNLALIDLNALSVRFYQALGPDVAPRAFADGGNDKTHFNNYGGYSLARCVVEGLRAADPALTGGLETHLAGDFERFDPDHPPPPPASPPASP